MRSSGVTPDRPDGLGPRLVPVELLAEDVAPVRRSAHGASGIELHTGAVRIELTIGFDVSTLRRTLEALGC